MQIGLKMSWSFLMWIKMSCTTWFSKLGMRDIPFSVIPLYVDYHYQRKTLLFYWISLIEYISDYIILWPLNEQNSSLNISVNISTHLGKFLHTTIVLYRGVINQTSETVGQLCADGSLWAEACAATSSWYSPPTTWRCATTSGQLF